MKLVFKIFGNLNLGKSQIWFLLCPVTRWVMKSRELFFLNTATNLKRIGRGYESPFPPVLPHGFWKLSSPPLSFFLPPMQCAPLLDMAEQSHEGEVADAARRAMADAVMDEAEGLGGLESEGEIWLPGRPGVARQLHLSEKKLHLSGFCCCAWWQHFSVSVCVKCVHIFLFIFQIWMYTFFIHWRTQGRFAFVCPFFYA